MLKFIDPSSYLLEIVSAPIKKYLRERKDTMRCIINTILTEDDSSIKEDMRKQYIKSSTLTNQNAEYENLSSDEDEKDAENWEPSLLNSNIPDKNANFNVYSTKSKFSDIISTLVNIFGSPEKFIEQYKRMLAERSVSDNNFSLENEIKNIEMLKLKFGENLLQGCDILIKDVKDSIKINNSVINIFKNVQILPKEQDFEINCLIINKNFWPFKNEEKYDIKSGDTQINDNFSKFVKCVKNKFDHYKNKYSQIKISRNLDVFTNIGFVDLSLTFDNGTFNFRVTPLSALIINMFNETNSNTYKNYTVEYISDKLNCSVNDVKRKLNFWVNKGVLSEKSNSNNDSKFLEEEIFTFYEPNQFLKNMEISNNLIIEDDIFSFEYVAENENALNLENAINSIIKNAGPRNFEQLFKNLVISYQINISELKLKEILGKMILEQKIFKEGELYKLISSNN